MNINLEKNENHPLNGFIDFINSKNGISRKKTGSVIGKPINLNQILFEILSTALVIGWRPNSVCSLQGYDLTVHGKTKKLNLNEMDSLYILIQEKNNSGGLYYVPSGIDLTIMDGNSYSYSINWNGIISQGNGGHTMPSGLIEIINYCNKIVNN